jgi:hypothetical protein
MAVSRSAGLRRRDPAALHEPVEIAQAGFCLGGRHMIQESVGDHNFLKTKGFNQARIVGGADAPADPIPEAKSRFRSPQT